ncbi:hypothetical protein ACHQM5_017661 [Ranunculus cassubicifolius]
MADIPATDVEKLYEHSDRLAEAKDKSNYVKDYEGIIQGAKGSIKAKQLAAQLIPRYFKFFPNLAQQATNAHFDLVEEEELGIRVQAIRGLTSLCEDMPEHVPKIVDVLGQLLTSEENVERDAVNKSLLSLLRKDPKASFTGLFKHLEGTDSTDESVREQVLGFIKDKVFPIKAELLKPQEEMERYITDLVKKSLQDVTGQEFKMFVDFLKTLKMFSETAPPERMQELTEIIEEQADLHKQFDVSDVNHIDRVISCLYMSQPFFKRGASNSKLLNYLNKHILPAADKFPEERKLDLLKNLAESSPYTAPQDSRLLLPSIVALLKKHMPLRKTGEELNFTYVECLLYTFHHLASKTPNATNSLCGYKIVTGQPSDRLGEDFSENYKDFTERVSTIDNLIKITMKKLNQGQPEIDKSLGAAKTDEEKAKIRIKKLNTAIGLRTCNNILTMTQPLRTRSPSFIADDKITPSWKPPPKPSVQAGKRAATETNTSNSGNKRVRGEGGSQHQLVNRTFKDVYRGGQGSGSDRGQGGGKNQFASRALKGLFRGGRGGGRGRGRARGSDYYY